MSEHARIVNGQPVEFRDIDPAIRAAWIAAGNPKAAEFLPVNVDALPEYGPRETIDAMHIVGQNAVRRAWLVRDLTPDELRQVWTSYEFLGRFTAVERATIRDAALADAGVADFLMLAQAAQDIVSDDPVTIAGMDYLVSLSIITPARRAEILP